jgi:basic membrane lipoprotein Med (substrate-binding protein (PBP1-ABC) superfamily)
MLSIETIPLPVRAALATATAIVAGRLGYSLTESEAAVLVVVVLWAVGGIADAAWTYGFKRRCDTGDCE